jgi:hypothetical protein
MAMLHVAPHSINALHYLTNFMQRIIVIGVLLLYTPIMNACNVCGCSAMSSSPGILPNFRTHFIGFRESHKTIHIEHPVSLLNPESQKSTESFASTELWGRWYPHQRLQVFGFMPFNRLSRTVNEQTISKAGFGDLSIMVNYLVFNTGDSIDRNVKQALLLGSGVKLKTGKFNPEESAGFQIGSGSRDWQFFASHTLRYQQVGMLNELSYRLPGLNPQGYQFGNRLIYSVKAFYWSKIKNLTVLPHIGYAYENAQADHLNSIRQSKTGSEILSAGVGVDLYYKDFSLGCNAYQPFKQNINAGQVSESYRIQINLIYNFKTSSKCN